MICGKRFVLISLLLLSVCSWAPAVYISQPGGDPEKASELSKVFRQKIESLKNDLEAYKRQLIRSEQELRALQLRLEQLQMELTASSKDLTIALESSRSFSNSLDELSRSLQAERARALRDKVLLMIAGLIGGFFIGFACGAS